MNYLYDNWKEYALDQLPESKAMKQAISKLEQAHDAFEVAMKNHDCRNGYTPERYAHEARVAVQAYIDAHYRHENLMTAKDFAILGAAIQVLKERANG